MKAKAGLRILAIDDQPAVLLTYKLILQQQGYTVMGAATYEQAIELLHNEPWDLLLCDFSLDGGYSGFDIVDAARLCHREIGCLLLTGYVNPEIAEQAARRGIVVLNKPAEVPELLRQLERLASPKRSETQMLTAAQRA